MPLRNQGIGFNRKPSPYLVNPALGGAKKVNHPAAYRALTPKLTPKPEPTQYGPHECKFNPKPMYDGINVRNVLIGGAIGVAEAGGSPAGAVVGMVGGLAGGIIKGAAEAVAVKKECEKKNVYKPTNAKKSIYKPG